MKNTQVSTMWTVAAPGWVIERVCASIADTTETRDAVAEKAAVAYLEAGCPPVPEATKPDSHFKGFIHLSRATYLDLDKHGHPADVLCAALTLHAKTLPEVVHGPVIAANSGKPALAMLPRNLRGMVPGLAVAT